MERDRFGLVGRVVADRPILSILVLAFGLAALAVIGASDANAGAPAAVVNLQVASLALTVSPLVIAAAAPRMFAIRIIIGAAVSAVVVAFYIYAPMAIGIVAPVSVVVGFVVLSWVFLVVGPLFGAMTQFVFIAAGAGVVGMAGAFGMVLQQGMGAADAVPLIAAAFAVSAIVGAGAIADFAVFFAGGADRRRAAGLAARRAVAPSVYAAVTAALAFGGAAVRSEQADSLLASALAGFAVLLCATPALIASAGALSLRRANEQLAVDENRRRQRFRRFWRPFRYILPPNASLAMVAIAAIMVVATAFNIPEKLSPLHLAYAIVSAAGAGLIFFSLRAGLFVLFLLVVSSALGGWLWNVLGWPMLAPGDEAASMALAAALFGAFAQTWSDARSPRLNARETTEAAMSDAFGEHILGVMLTVACFYAASSSGAWPGGLAAAGFLSLMATIGLLLSAPLMTALSHLVRRELA